MKKFILSCFVFLGGFLGAIGWAIACASKVAGGRSTVSGCIHNEDWVIIFVLAVVALIGFLSAVREIKQEK